MPKNRSLPQLKFYYCIIALIYGYNWICYYLTRNCYDELFFKLDWRNFCKAFFQPFEISCWIMSIFFTPAPKRVIVDTSVGYIQTLNTFQLKSLSVISTPGPVCHNNSVLNHRISIMIFTMTRVLIMALIRHFMVKFIVKFWISYEHNDFFSAFILNIMTFFSAFILNIMTFPLNLFWSVWQNKLNLMKKRTKRRELQLIQSNT